MVETLVTLGFHVLHSVFFEVILANADSLAFEDLLQGGQHLLLIEGRRMVEVKVAFKGQRALFGAKLAIKAILRYAYDPTFPMGDTVFAQLFHNPIANRRLVSQTIGIIDSIKRNTFPEAVPPVTPIRNGALPFEYPLEVSLVLSEAAIDAVITEVRSDGSQVWCSQKSSPLESITAIFARSGRL